MDSCPSSRVGRPHECRVRDRTQYIREIERLSGDAETHPRGPGWLRAPLFDEAAAITFVKMPATDDTLRRIGGLTTLRELNLFNNELTDAGLAHLQGLTSLLDLDLSDTPVTDAGLLHLTTLSGLRRLHLKGTLVTDAGIADLKLTLPRLTIDR